jgi:prepilin-type N-terminal cleavage/methylation domain-containing protein
MKNLSKKGFTLVELLVVISIIALLSTIAIVSLGSARAKARDTARIADMKQVSTALEQFYADQGGYPIEPAVMGTTTYEIGQTADKALCNLNGTPGGLSWNTLSACGTNTVYMGNIPAAPTPPAKVACNALTPVANFCYGSKEAWSAATTFASSYSLVWLLEASNTNLGGSACTTTPNGVTCS